MLRTLGGLSIDETDFSRPVPLLLLTYLSVEMKGNYCQRYKLSNLFWTDTVQKFDNALSLKAYGLYLLLEEAWKKSQNLEIQLPFSEISNELDYQASTLVEAKRILRGLHKELGNLGITTDASIHTDESSTEIMIRYCLTDEVIRHWNRGSTSEDMQKRNLRVALHKLAKCTEPSLIQKDKKRVRTLISSDVEALEKALNANAIRQAKQLYKGHFLDGIEGWLLETRYKPGQALLEWITHKRKDIGRKMQLGFLAGAIDAYNANDQRAAARLAHEALHVFPEQLLDKHDVTTVANLLRAGAHPRTEDDLARLQAELFDIPSISSSEAAATALAADPRFRPSSKLFLHVSEGIENLSSQPNSKLLTGRLPISRIKHFQGRGEELQWLNQTLSRKDVSVVQLVGRSGIGKTSLITKFVDAVDKNPPFKSPFSAISYTTFHRGQQYSLDSVVKLVSSTLPPDKASELAYLWKAQTSTEDKLEQLFTHFLNGRYLLLIWDSLEKALTEEGEFEPQHKDLRQFAEACLQHEHNLTLLLASQNKVAFQADILARALDQYGGELGLDKGLTKEESVALLTSLDHDGQLGLRGADETVLDVIYDMTSGQPRMLENIVGILRQSPTLTLNELTSNRVALERLIDDPTKAIYLGLSDSQRWVVEALAVYGTPVTENAISYMLASQGAAVPQILRDLVRNYVVVFDRTSKGEYALHEADQVYIYRHLSERRSEETLRHLHKTAALFYAENVKSKPWQEIDDVRSNLAAIHHLLQAKDFEAAFQELEAIDYDFLRIWGYADLLIQLYGQIVNHLPLGKTQGHCLNALGRAHNQLGNFENAIRYFHDALRVSSQIGDEHLSEKLLGNLGLAYYHLNIFDLAIMHFEEALKRVQTQGRKTQEQEYLGYKALCHLEQDELDEAVQLFQQARESCLAFQLERGAYIWQGALAKARFRQGCEGNGPEYLNEAEALARDALEYCHQTKFRTSEAANLDNLGKIYQVRGQNRAAVALWLTSHLIWADMHSHYQNETLAQLYALSKKTDIFVSVVDLSRDGDALLKKVTGIAYSTFADAPPNLVDTVRTWLSSYERSKAPD